MAKRLMVSFVRYEMTVLVGHTEDDTREDILKKAYGATGEVEAGSEDISLLENDDDLADYGVERTDGVDTTTEKASEYAHWSLDQILDDTDEAAHNRAMNKNQLVMHFAPENPGRLRGVNNDMVHIDDHYEWPANATKEEP